LFGFELRRVAVQAMSAVNGLRQAFRRFHAPPARSRAYCPTEP
jgi:hypothetical protein